MRWSVSWVIVKDVLLTGTGVAVIFSQVLSAHPSDVLLAAGLALTVPSVAGHAGALLAGHQPSSSPPSPPPGPQPSSSSSSGGNDEGPP